MWTITPILFSTLEPLRLAVQVGYANVVRQQQTCEPGLRLCNVGNIWNEVNKFVALVK